MHPPQVSDPRRRRSPSLVARHTRSQSREGAEIDGIRKHPPGANILSEQSLIPPPPNQQDNDETAMNNVWLLWKPHEMMTILLGVPKKRNPQAFIEFLRTTISVYHADS